MDLKTNYLGTTLPHPIIAGASPLGSEVDTVRQLEDAGIAAIVLPSLFEEQIIDHQIGWEKYVCGYSNGFGGSVSSASKVDEKLVAPEDYLEHIQRLKSSVNIPLIASLNGIHPGGWEEYAEQFEEAGADAIELNLYVPPRDQHESASQLEKRMLEIIQSVREATTLHVAVKLTPAYTSLNHFAQRAHKAGADALVVFNRYYLPDFDVNNLTVEPKLTLSNSHELLLRLHTLTMLHGRLPIELALTGGAHTAKDILKGILAGADCIQLVSAILKHGVGIIPKLLQDLCELMEELDYESIQHIKGSMSTQHVADPAAIERANYINIIRSSWNG